MHAGKEVDFNVHHLCWFYSSSNNSETLLRGCFREILVKILTILRGDYHDVSVRCAANPIRGLMIIILYEASPKP